MREPTIAITIRTANRRPKGPNYLGQTVRGLVAQGVAPADVNLFPTAPETGWLARELGPLAEAVTIHAPRVQRTPNANGLAQVSVLDVVDADWVLLLEDDLEFCADVVGSMQRWLARHASEQYRVYRFFSFGHAVRHLSEASEYPLREQRGSQAVALRAADARDLVAWQAQHTLTWRPHMAPFSNHREKGFDKLIGYWALARWPQQTVGLVSRPFFVRHVGDVSSLHQRAIRNDGNFAGAAWRYAPREGAA